MSGLNLSQFVTVRDLIEELSSVTQFSDEIDGTLALVDLVQTDDVWMREVLENVNLIFQTHSLDLVHGELVNHFDSANVSSGLVSGFSNLTKGTLTENFAVQVVVLREG